MPYFMRIVSAQALHAGYLPGYPRRTSCIRMPEFMAENFFKSVRSERRSRSPSALSGLVSGLQKIPGAAF